MPRIQVYDTTLRDGAQGEGVSFSLEDKLLITRRLAELGFDFVEGGYPLSNEKDAQYFQQARDLDLGQTRVCAFGMTRRRGVEAAGDIGMRALVESGAPVVTVVGKSSPFQVREVLGVSLEENLAMIAESLEFLASQGRQLIYDAEHFFDAYKDDAAYALETLRRAAEAGASTVVLCDTNGGSLPEEVARTTAEVVEALGDGVLVGIHCHNDCDVAVANSLAAVDAGARQVQGTINGFGERCGNADLVSVAANLALKKPGRGYELLSAGSVERLTELSRYVYELANMSYRTSQPFVGPSAFAHKGGMHVHAVSKTSRAYEHIDPESVGNERRVLVSELSGRSNIVALTTKLDIEHDRDLMQRILDRVVALENEGYQFEAAEASFDLLVKKVAGTYRPWFERIHYRVHVDTDRLQGPWDEESVRHWTDATVKLRVRGEDRFEAAEGDGPVNALDAALRKALNGTFPGLRDMELVDYKVRVINSEAGTAAKVRVVIESRDSLDREEWGTVGVSENIIEASWMALVDSFEYKLYKEDRRRQARQQAPQEAEAAPALGSS